MKKIIALFIMSIMFLCTACVTQEKQEIEQQVTYMKSICELATMECYYHNVAKYEEKDVEGILWWQKDMKFWIEYAGVVTIGIDASLVNMEVKNEEVKITIPPAKVLGCKVDEETLSIDLFVIASDSAKLTPEAQTEAFKEAQDKMLKEATKNKALLSSAQQRAQKLLEDYVNNIGESIGKQYKIKWVYVDENGKKI